MTNNVDFRQMLKEILQIIPLLNSDQPEVFEPYTELDSTWQEDPVSV